MTQCLQKKTQKGAPNTPFSCKKKHSACKKKHRKELGTPIKSRRAGCVIPVILLKDKFSFYGESSRSPPPYYNLSVYVSTEHTILKRKLKIDTLTERVDDDVDDYSLLQNKSQDQLLYLKHLLSQTLQDNQRLKQTVDKYRSVEHGNEFDSFELF